jgi:hypothetical protein
LVERAWKRGLEVGRTKRSTTRWRTRSKPTREFRMCFSTWARRSDKRLQFEFLDNTVRLGDRPRTVAFGDNATCNVLDVSGLLNIERYGRVNVDAMEPDCIYPSRELLAPERNTAFLSRCLKRFCQVNFADQGTGRIYLHVEGGHVEWIDREPLQWALKEADVMVSVMAVAPTALAADARQVDAARYLSHHVVAPTLGEWGLGVSRRPSSYRGAANPGSRSTDRRGRRDRGCAAASIARQARYRASPTLR